MPANGAAYTAILRGKNDTTGIGLIELYDLAQRANAKLANISTRGFVDVGDNVMIGGFIITRQTGSATVLIRGLGPSLPVTGALADPTLELVDGNGNSLASDDNWRDTQEADIAATGIPASNALESGIVRSLIAGNYTVILRGQNNTKGIGLVEVYNLQ